MFNLMDPEELLKQIEDMGEGDLTLFIGCTKCSANYEISRDAATLAILTKTTFLEFLKYVQNSKCCKCNPEKEEL